jgi:hypothetical protein
MTTLDVPEGAEEEPACRRFLKQALAGLRRRELSVGLYRTVGPVGPGGPEGAGAALAGAVVGAPTDPEVRILTGEPRGLRMRPGITDVGIVVAAVLPTAPAPTGAASG